MKSIMTDHMSRREFLKTNATALLALGIAPYYLQGCANHDEDEVNRLMGIKSALNPFNGVTIGDAYLLYQDTLQSSKAAFESEKLIRLCRSTSQSWQEEIITTTNRARRTEDDFSLGIAIAAKAKMLGGAMAFSNAFNKSDSRIEMNNSLTWNSKITQTGDIWYIDWENYQYTELYGCLKKGAQGKLKTIFDLYNKVAQLLKDNRIESTEGIETAQAYSRAVRAWYDQYGYGFVSGLWVGMLGKATLTITSKATNTTSTWNNTTSVSYTSPVGGAGLSVAVDSLSADFQSTASGSVVIEVTPANEDMKNWSESWKKQFIGKLDSISSMLKIDPTPSTYGKKIDPPAIELPKDKVDPDVSSKFTVTNLETAKECARVIDWEKNRKPDESFDDYEKRKQTEKEKEAQKYQNPDDANDQNVQQIIEDNGHQRLVGQDGMPALQVNPVPDPINTDSTWADFMRNWTTLGVYITRWADVIPQLTMATEVSTQKADLNSGLVYLWAVGYQTELIRFADYLDMCLPYAKDFAWQYHTANIASFREQIRRFANDFNEKIQHELKEAQNDPKYTIQTFFNNLKKTKDEQREKMSMQEMFDCWTKNYGFFKRADFGCGLVMMPEGLVAKDSKTNPFQFFLSGPHARVCHEYNYAYEVSWRQSTIRSDRYVNDPTLFTGKAAKLLPLITVDGQIMLLMIGSSREEGWSVCGMLDSQMMMRDKGHYNHDEAFKVGSLAKVAEIPKEELPVFLAKDVGQRVNDMINRRFTKPPWEWYGHRIYQDPGTTDQFFLWGNSALVRCDEFSFVKDVWCSDKTAFYLVPLGGFADGQQVRGVKISGEVPEYVANPFNLYTSQTVEDLLQDIPSAIYDSIPPASIEDYMIGSINEYRIWKGILPDPRV
jgi:hypothetical protein